MATLPSLEILLKKLVPGLQAMNSSPWKQILVDLPKMPELLAKGRKDTQEESLDRASGEKCSVGMENGVAPSDEKPPNHLQEFGPQLKIIKINEQVRELQTIIRDR